MRDDFQRAFERVTSDTQLDDGRGADLIAVGVERTDCLEFLEWMLDNEAVTPELLAMIVQWAVAIGVWIERERWLEGNRLMEGDV